MMGEKMNDSLVRIDPEVMSGTPCFAGTRVPIRTLTDSLTAGDTIEGFLEGFPGVSRAQVLIFLEEAAEQVAGIVAEREGVA